MAAPDNNENLINYIKRSLEEEEDFHFLRFESLERINIVAQEVRLIRLKSEIQSAQKISDAELKNLKDALKDYSTIYHRQYAYSSAKADKTPATAIRDYQFLRNQKTVDRREMHKRRLLLQRWFQAELGVGHPFWSHYSYFKESDSKIDPVRAFLMRRLPVWLTYSKNERSDRQKEYNEGSEPKDVSLLVDRLARFLITITSGLFLIVPMLIMAIHASEKKSLITVSASVFLFVLVLSFGVQVTNVEALVSTATYAAVLVVFVGTSSGGGGNV
jgi:hypothetical protein